MKRTGGAPMGPWGASHVAKLTGTWCTIPRTLEASLLCPCSRRREGGVGLGDKNRRPTPTQRWQSRCAGPRHRMQPTTDAGGPRERRTRTVAGLACQSKPMRLCAACLCQHQSGPRAPESDPLRTNREDRLCQPPTIWRSPTLLWLLGSPTSTSEPFFCYGAAAHNASISSSSSCEFRLRKSFLLASGLSCTVAAAHLALATTARPAKKAACPQ